MATLTFPTMSEAATRAMGGGFDVVFTDMKRIYDNGYISHPYPGRN